MSHHYKRYTREDVMQGIVHISGTLCDFECVIVGNSPQQHKVDNGVYTIDYNRTKMLKQMLNMEMIETRRDKNVVRRGQQSIDATSNFNPNASDLVKLINWALNYLRQLNYEELNEPMRVDRAITASIEKVNKWFDVLEAKGVSIFERPEQCEPFTPPPGIVYVNQSICTEDFFNEYRRRMGMINIQNAHADFNKMVNNVVSGYNPSIQNVLGAYKYM